MSRFLTIIHGIVYHFYNVSFWNFCKKVANCSLYVFMSGFPSNWPCVWFYANTRMFCYCVSVAVQIRHIISQVIIFFPFALTILQFKFFHNSFKYQLIKWLGIVQSMKYKMLTKIKKCVTSLIVKKMQIKTILRVYITSVRMEVTKNV